MKTKIYTIIAIFVWVSLFLTGCSKSKSLVGVWEADDGNMYVFTSDNSYYILDSPDEKMEYRQNEKTLIFSYQDETIIVDYEIDNDVLIMRRDDGDGNSGVIRAIKISDDYEDYSKLQTDSSGDDLKDNNLTDDNSSSESMNNIPDVDYAYRTVFTPMVELTEDKFLKIEEILNDRFSKAGVEGIAYSENNNIIIDAMDQLLATDLLTTRGHFAIKDENETELMTSEYFVNCELTSITDNDNNINYNALIKLNEEGAKLFAEVTSNNSGKSIGFYMNDNMFGSVVVNEVITGGEFYIPLGNDKESAEKYVNIFTSGELPCYIEVVEHLKIE